MLVSWSWLSDYVRLDMPVEEVERRLMMAGLNHESTARAGDDVVIDFEVTSNRADCLGHLGIAREIATLWGREICLPKADPCPGSHPVAVLARVTVECPDLCPRYTARVVRGVRVGPSPAWLAARLQAVGVATINNIVDITNYVLLECGQPLHAFDLGRLRGGAIVVRRPRAGEQLEAIDHRVYELNEAMCIIADAERPVGIGGVMGGAETEVSAATTDVLLEAAQFDPLAIRGAARALNLHSPSSYRFERGLDPHGVDWASRRACELILELAGGELAAGVLDVGTPPVAREPIVLRFAQLKRILGIEVPADEVEQILVALGHRRRERTGERIEVTPPTWRRDLTREIDLIEEVARIHGYEQIPEDALVPMARSARTPADRVLGEVRATLTAAGFDEALTLSVVEEPVSEAFSPWSDLPALRTQMPILRRATLLRRSLVPSLLAVRRTNEALSNPTIELFEIASAYLPSSEGPPREERLVGLTTGGDFLALKGVVEELVARLNPAARVTVGDYRHALFAPGRAVQLHLDGETLGYLGEVSVEARKAFDLRGATTVAELRFGLLAAAAQLIRPFVPLADKPAIQRDINLELAESVRWAQLAAVVEEVCGPKLEALDYLETYRDRQRLGADRKSLVFRLTLRDPQATLTGAEADALRDRVVAVCADRLGAKLRLG
ncbi:MAG: phenylalanine--tRNA ligase subunit beta [Pirellulales bacterium]|nr:phenylalanine--tRNA ligase subunit beta [Pirellulales bacterium]